MIDEIRRHCALLLAEDVEDHIAAYLWLRKCEPFRRVVDRLRRHELTLFDVAACLAVGSERPLAGASLMLLAEEVERQENGTRETTLL